MDGVAATVLKNFTVDTIFLKCLPTNFMGSSTLAAAFALLIALRLYRFMHIPLPPRLAGPPSRSFLWGAKKDMLSALDLGVLYAEWGRKYGAVYEVPSPFGSKTLVLGDPKGLSHFFANDTIKYDQPQWIKVLCRRLFGVTLALAGGETHKRLRRAMSPAFSTSAIQNVLPVFLNSAGKLTAAWNSLCEPESKSEGGSVGSITVDITKWMNYLSFDNLGKGAFSHDFGLLTGGRSPVAEILEALTSLTEPTLSVMTFHLLGPISPELLLRIPNTRVEMMKASFEGVKEIAVKFMKKKPDGGEKSILGALIASQTENSKAQMSPEEIEAQCVRFFHDHLNIVGLPDGQYQFLVAGYTTTAITLTWAFIELARNPEIQKTLRVELEEQIPAGEVTYDTLMNGLAYLDAFVCEILRFHPGEVNLVRQAIEDDTIPLSKPIVTASGSLVDNLTVAKGTMIEVPIIGINRSEALWGSDAATFDPTRWLEEKPGEFNKQREEIQGYRHLVTFAHGPRTCIGRMFVITAIKAILSILVRRFTFEFPGGSETPIIGPQISVLRPRVIGEEGVKVPLLIRKVLND